MRASVLHTFADTSRAARGGTCVFRWEVGLYDKACNDNFLSRYAMNILKLSPQFGIPPWLGEGGEASLPSPLQMGEMAHGSLAFSWPACTGCLSLSESIEILYPPPTSHVDWLVRRRSALSAHRGYRDRLIIPLWSIVGIVVARIQDLRLRRANAKNRKCHQCYS